MDLSFAKDANAFSQAVEQLRREGRPIVAETIKEVYDRIVTPEQEEAREIEEASVDMPKVAKKRRK